MRESEKTLEAAIARGAEGVWLYCAPCLNGRAFSPAQSLKNWPPQATFREIADKARCSKCGRRPTKAIPHWKLRSRGGSPPERYPPKDWGRF